MSNQDNLSVSHGISISFSWDAIAIISTSCSLACLFVWAGELYCFISKALLSILAVFKISEAAATVPAMSEADMLHVIDG